MMLDVCMMKIGAHGHQDLLFLLLEPNAIGQVNYMFPPSIVGESGEWLEAHSLSHLEFFCIPDVCSQDSATNPVWVLALHRAQYLYVLMFFSLLWCVRLNHKLRIYTRAEVAIAAANANSRAMQVSRTMH